MCSLTLFVGRSSQHYHFLEALTGSLRIVGHGVGTEVPPNPAQVVSDEPFRGPATKCCDCVINVVL